MVMRSESVGVSCRVQFDVPAQDVGERTRLQKVDNPQSALMVRGGIFNQQSAGHQKISRKKNPGSAVVKCHVGLAVSGRRDYVYSSVTQIQMGNPVGPVSETEERSNSLQIYGHDLDRWKRRKLRIAGAMIEMAVRMRHQEWKLFVILIRQ